MLILMLTLVGDREIIQPTCPLFSAEPASLFSSGAARPCWLGAIMQQGRGLGVTIAIPDRRSSHVAETAQPKIGMARDNGTRPWLPQHGS